MKNLKAIILLFVANFVSSVAQGISMLAIPWYFTMESDMERFGLIYLVTNVIALFWVPYSGTLVDKYNRKNIFLVLMGVIGSIILSIALLGFKLESLPWILIVFVFMLTFFNYNLHYPTLYSFVQEITEEKYYSRITSILEIQGQLATILSGAGAAFLLEGTSNGVLNVFGFSIDFGFELIPWHIYEIFLLDATTYFLAFGIILFIKFTPLKQRKKIVESVGSQLRTGWKFLIDNKSIFVFGVASYAIFVTILIEGFYLLPIYVKNHMHEGGDVFASADMYYALGAVLSGVFIRTIFKKIKIPESIIILTFFTGLIYFALYFKISLGIFFLLYLALGIANAGSRIQRVNFLFLNIPNQVYGRANSIFNMANILFRVSFLAIFSLTFFQLKNNIIYAFLILGIFLLMACIVLYFNSKQFNAKHSFTNLDKASNY